MTHATSNSLELNFGKDTTWQVPGRPHVCDHLAPRISPLADLSSAVDLACTRAIEFPSLDQLLVPGDSLVLAVDAGIPSLDALLPAVLSWFTERGTAVENLSVVLAGHARGIAEDVSKAIHSTLGKEIDIEIHDPDDPDKLAYVAANSEADPIYMNRRLVDADVVIPLHGCRPAGGLDYLGAYSLYPLLSDRPTRGQFYRAGRLANPGSHQKLNKWADQAARWAGFMVGIQVIPAAGEEIGAIFSGLTAPLEVRCQQEMTAAWGTEVDMSDLTIALVDGGAAQQNWLSLARALYTANRCTNDHGAIVLCTELNESIGKSLSKLKRSQASTESLARRLDADSADDSILAALINQVTNNKHIYLVSKLKPEVVEGLRLGVIRNAEELTHLIDQFPSCNILGSAQYREIQLK